MRSPSFSPWRVGKSPAPLETWLRLFHVILAVAEAPPKEQRCGLGASFPAICTVLQAMEEFNQVLRATETESEYGEVMKAVEKIRVVVANSIWVKRQSLRAINIAINMALSIHLV